MLEIGRKIWERERERERESSNSGGEKNKKKNAMVKQISRQIS